MSSLSKNQLKALAAYRIQKRCDDEGVFIVEGEKMCHEALASEHRILVVCATAASFPFSALRSHIVRKWLTRG